MGCPVGAKASTDVTHWPMALKHGAHIVTGARVSQITLNTRGLATGAIYFDRNGNEHFQPASVVILAANGIGTPRLLLMSASSRFPAGLANSTGLVGKRLMLHPTVTVVGQYQDSLEEWVGPPAYIESRHFYETDSDRGFVRGAKWLLAGYHGPLQTLNQWMSGEDGHRLQQWGDGYMQNLREAIGHQMRWTIVSEDLPEESNFVALDSELKDSSGLPAPKIVYRYSENSRRLLDFHIARAQEAHQAAGAKRTRVVGRGPGEWEVGHLLGTARMGDDPELSVVDRFGRAHDVPNLYIVDGSVFVTAAGVNPTGTICALAMRSAAHILQAARMQGGSG
jgi:choline dehydrogenase-like flavoprotein